MRPNHPLTDQPINSFLLFVNRLIGYSVIRLKNGFSIIEIIVAMGIFIIMASTGVTTILHSFSANRTGEEQTKATVYAQSGVEAARSIRNQSWSALVNGTYGLSQQSGNWEFAGSSDADGKFTRAITVSDVYRNASNNIVTSGGNLDTDSKKISSIVTWTTVTGRVNTVQLDYYLTNYDRSIGCSSWSAPSQESSINLSGVDNGIKIQTQGNYAYMTRESGSPDFAVIDITNTASPVLRGTLNLDGGQNNVAVMGNYVYIASYSDTRELQIINIANPDAPTLVGSYNAAGTADGLGIHLDVTTVYLTRVSSTDRELFVINVSNPASPTLLGSFDLGANGEEIMVVGNYAYITSSSDSQEFRILNISNPASITSVGSYNISGTYDGQSITGFNSTILVGLNEGGVYVFNVSNPSIPSLVGSYNAFDDVEYMVLSPDNSCVFLATDYVNREFQAVNLTVPSSPSLAGGVNITDNINGIAYHTGKNRVFLNTKMDGAEFVAVQP